ncbi:hypothetical protein LJC34_01965 [Oscillospiraceae bacterium OttesenSCG-928-G22]|nr:hypothetical protein [Oscillospiraceae bacterium OttesenSCG-928-G22]
MFTLNYGTGAGDTTHESIEECMEMVDFAYTQTSVYIVDENNCDLWVAQWWGMPYNPEEDDDEPLADFGSFGYYSQWVNLT